MIKFAYLKRFVHLLWSCIILIQWLSCIVSHVNRVPLCYPLLICIHLLSISMSHKSILHKYCLLWKFYRREEDEYVYGTDKPISWRVRCTLFSSIVNESKAFAGIFLSSSRKMKDLNYSVFDSPGNVFDVSIHPFEMWRFEIEDKHLLLL